MQPSKSLFPLIIIVSFQSLSFSQTYNESAILNASVQGTFDAFGQESDIYGDRLVVTSSNENGTVFLFDLIGSTWEETIITSSDGETIDIFGRGVSLQENRLIVGAPGDDVNGIVSGSSYIYDYDGSNWNETKIIPSDGTNYDNFGFGVGTYGDRFVVGSFLTDADSINAGSIYIYDWDGTSWNESKLTSTNPRAGGYMGHAVAIYEDRIVTNSSYATGGAVIVYDWNGNTWIETTITPSDVDIYDNFAYYDVDISADRIIAGSPYDEDNGELSGSLYIFDWDGSSWNETKIIASDGQAGDQFGRYLGIEGDKIVVSAHRADENGFNSGIVYLLKWDGQNWNEEKIIGSTTISHDQFGSSVEISENRFVSGASKAWNNFNDDGTVYVFDCDSDIFYEDSDNDGYGNSELLINACSLPTGYVLNNLDCNDLDDNIYPGAIETCDGIDNDCNIEIDDDFNCACVNGLIINTFIGTNTSWINNSNWSLGEVPTICHHAIIPNDKTVLLSSGESGICYLLTVNQYAIFEVDAAASLKVVAPNID